MDTHAQSQPRPRKRQRPRVSESASTTVPAAVPPQAWGSGVAAHPTTAVRGAVGDTVSVPQPPTTGFPSQQLDRSHQVAEADGLMNGYTAPQQHQYPDTQSSLAPTSQTDPSGLGNLSSGLNSIAGDTSNANPHHPHAHQHHLQQTQAQQQPPQQQQQRPSAAAVNKTDRVLFQHYGAPQPTGDSPPATVANSAPAAPYNLPVWPAAGPATPSSAMPPQSPAPRLAPPPEGIYRTFDDLLNAVQKVAKDQGYGVVKLRASNYREGKPTRYDLVCDRGGVKYNSTAKKRNPSTRKIDCPWRAKAVCEVNLGNQWRFAVQESRHNHEPRMPTAAPGQENTPLAQSMRSISNKLDRMSHDIATNFEQLESRLESIEKRLESLEGRNPIMGANGVPTIGTASIPTANMGGATLGNGSLTNGGMGAGGILDGRMSNMEARVNAMEQRGNGMDTLPMMDDDAGRLAMMVNS